MNNKSNISKKLESSRKELLDLGLRNSLLNYRVSKSRSVDITGESSAEIFRLMVSENKIMSFLPAPEKSEDQENLQSDNINNQSHSNKITSNSKKNSNPLTDLWLQTFYSEKDLQKRLLSIYYHSHNYIRERGFDPPPH